jgi:hypothetical protein
MHILYMHGYVLESVFKKEFGLCSRLLTVTVYMHAPPVFIVICNVSARVCALYRGLTG